MITVTEFLNERMDGILKREQGNTNMVYLYNVNDTWAAVEKSAYFLSQLVPCNVLTLLAKRNKDTFGGQIVLASVSDAYFNGSNNEYSVIHCDHDFRVLKLKNIPTHYAEWRQENLVSDLDPDDFDFC